MLVAEIGTTLRDARLERGLSIDEVARATRISSRFLVALEEDDYDELPAPVYVRGFLRLYAEQVGLDAEALIEHLPRGLAMRVAPSRQTPSTGVDRVLGGEGLEPHGEHERVHPPELIDDLAPAEGARHRVTHRRASTREAAASEGREASLRALVTQLVRGTPEPAVEAEGVLLERRPREPRVPRSRKLLVVAAGGLCGLAVLIAGVLAFSGGGGGTLEGLLQSGGPTQGPRTETVIPVGRPTSAPSPSPEVSPSPVDTTTE